MLKNKYPISIFILGVMLFLVAACTRDLDELELATYPTTPDVFLDGFSEGLNYSAFGGSKVTAFEVDTEVKYAGSASMQFAVPSFEDPAGAYAGGAFTTDVGRDLSGYDALTFWGRSSQPVAIDLIGFGNDLGENKYESSLSGVAMTTNWKKYYIPIADASKLVSERGMLYYATGPADGKGFTFWLDEVKFEKLGTIAHPKPAILETQEQVISVEIGDTPAIGGTYSTFNLPNGTDQRVNLNPNYFTFTSSNPSIATVGSNGVATVIGEGSSTITAKLKDLDAAGSLTLISSGEAVSPTESAPLPTVSQDSVISLFSNVYSDVLVDTWNPFWEFSTTEVADLKIGDDDIKKYSNLNFVGILTESEQINASTMTHFHIDIWTPNATEIPASFKVLLVDFGGDQSFGGGDDSSHELSFTSPTLQSENWVSLDIPLANFASLSNRSNIAQLVLSGDLSTVFVDNIYFYDRGSFVASGPSDAAPSPTRSSDDVIAIFSDTYTVVDGTNLNPDWGQGTTVSELDIFGNNTLLLGGLDYQGIALDPNLNVSEMTHLHLDYWTANSSGLNVFLISPGPIEAAESLSVPSSSWASVDIPLSKFSPVELADLFQFKFEGSGDIYIDNIYFYKSGGSEETEPATAAPAPTYDQSNVISIYSDAYTNVDGTNLNPDWGQATVTSEVKIEDNNTLKFKGLNYQGIELDGSQNVSEMTHLRIDYWTANSASFNLFLISPGPVETPYSLTVPSSGWQSLEIPLSNFSPVDLSDVFQFKFEGDGDIWIDNLLFYKE